MQLIKFIIIKHELYYLVVLIQLPSITQKHVKLEQYSLGGLKVQQSITAHDHSLTQVMQRLQQKVLN